MQPDLQPQRSLVGQSIRPIIYSDGPALAELHASLSDESRYLRFFSPHRRLASSELLHWIEVDQRRHAGFGAFVGARCVGHVLYDASEDAPDRAEVAIEVLDGYQGHGVGTRLLRAITETAQAAGIRTLTATVLPQNKKMLRVFRDLGFPERARYDRGVVRVEIEIGPHPAPQDFIQPERRKGTLQ